ncbi:MAG: LysR family transcriptional regulator [Pseudomonadota bacterium]
MHHEVTLRLIDEIARAGSIRGAAEKMSITPSALNRRLLAIEGELEVQLFERLATGVRLNAAGELFIVHARRQMADMKRLRSQIEDLKGARRGHVQIVYDTSLRRAGVLAAAMAAYQDDHPGVSFGVEVLSAEEIAPRLVGYRADLGVVLHPRTDSNLTTLASAPAEIALVTRPGHPLARGGAVRFEALQSYPLVVPPEGSLRAILERTARTRRLPLTPVLQADVDFARPRAAGGDAVGFEVDAGPAAARSPAPDGLARTPLSRQDVAAVYVHVVQLRDRPLSVAAGRFAEGIKQRFADLAG